MPDLDLDQLYFAIVDGNAKAAAAVTQEAVAADVDPQLLLTDYMIPAMAVELADTFTTLMEQTESPKQRLRLIRRLLPELAELRREDRKAITAMIERKRWERAEEERELADSRAEISKMKQKAAAPIWAGLKVACLKQVFGGGEAGRKAAGLLAELEYDLPPGYFEEGREQSAASEERTAPEDPSEGSEPGAKVQNQTKSNQIKPN